jgi:hypothetical protein
MNPEKIRPLGINSLGRPLSETESEELAACLRRELNCLAKLVSALLK